MLEFRSFLQSAADCLRCRRVEQALFRSKWACKRCQICDPRKSITAAIFPLNTSDVTGHVQPLCPIRQNCLVRRCRRCVIDRGGTENLRARSCRLLHHPSGLVGRFSSRLLTALLPARHPDTGRNPCLTRRASLCAHSRWRRAPSL